MTALKAHEVERFLRRPSLEAGVYLVYGPDAGLVRETAQDIARLFAAGEEASTTTLDGSELDGDVGRLAVEAKTASLFGEKRVVRVRGAGKSLVLPVTELLGGAAGAAIILEAGNLLPRDPLRALVEGRDGGWALPCFPDSERALAAMISDTFTAADIELAPDAAQALRDLLGNDREVTRRELEKLALHAAESRLLTREDVVALCADNAALVLDEVLDATGTGHAARLELAVNRALAAAVSPQQLLGSALQHFGALRRWRGEVDAGGAPKEVLDRQRPRPHFSRRATLEQQLRLWSDDALAAAIERLQLATSESRRRYGMQETIVRRALLGICMLAAER
ncbi:MAG TPA: DNA polymerase III subunit delta [Devosiaceae bacterium]|jgi:DNA polymerase-3 subunit delta|nr:DNA polymerase III subunit delta [Devosiaceae bacterium]